MEKAFLTLKLLLIGYLAYLVVFLGFSYDPAVPGYQPPFVIFIIDTINLFIHEAGHLFLKPFGMWIHVLGGSLFQILLPALLVVVSWRQNPTTVAYPGFWLGESMVNVSVYVRDAPVRQLRLIARGLIHDWNWLLSDNLDAAEPLADIVFVLGILICVSAVAAGVFFAIRSFREGPLTVAE